MRMFIVTLAVAFAGPAGAEVLQDYVGSATVLTTPGEGLHRVQVPFEAHRAARPDLADLRMFNAKGELLPFAFAATPSKPADERVATDVPLFPIRAAPKATAAGDVSLDVKATASGTLVALRTVPKGAPAGARIVSWVADASAVREPIGAVVVEWKREPGTEIARVALEASDDLREWSPFASGTVANLEEGARSLSQPRVEFAPRTVKYLRLTSSTSGFALTALKVERKLAAALAPLDTVTVGGRRGMRPGEYTYDLQAAVPISRVQLIFSEANAVAPVEIAARNDDREWRQVGSATFYRLTRGGAEVRSPALEISPYPARYWMVRFDPKAGAPAEAPRLEAGFRPREVVFAARGEGPYQLAFGREEAKRADLPLGTLIPDYKRDAEYQLPKAKVAAIGANPPAGWSLAQMLRGERGKKTLLWVVLVGGVAVLGFMAWRLLKSGSE